MRSIIKIATAVCVLGVGTTVQAASPLYTITGLGNFGGASAASGINNLGQVVGQADVDAGNYHAFLWTQAGGMKDLGVLPGDTSSTAISINDTGQVVGVSQPQGGNPPRGFMWQAEIGMSDIAGTSGLYTQPIVITNSGQIAGYASPDGFLQSNFGFTYSSQGGISPVSLSGVTTYGVEALNDSGEMVVDAPQSATSLFVASGQNPVEIAGGGLTEATASAMNASGTVVGSASSNLGGNSHAFVWSQSTGLLDITPIPGGDAFAQAVNGNGDVVGFEILGPGESESFLYRDGTTYDLTSLLGNSAAGWSALAPEGINDSGQIVGSGFFNGQVEAFIMSPAASATAFVPEPASLALLALGAAALLLRRRR